MDVAQFHLLMCGPVVSCHFADVTTRVRWLYVFHEEATSAGDTVTIILNNLVVKVPRRLHVFDVVHVTGAAGD